MGPTTSVYVSLYEWILPLRALRAAARFGYLYLAAIALAAAFGVAWLERRLKSPRSRHILAAAALTAVTIEVWSGPVPTQPFTRVPPIYERLRELPAPIMLVEVPFYPPDAFFENGEYMLNATAH